MRRNGGVVVRRCGGEKGGVVRRVVVYISIFIAHSCVDLRFSVVHSVHVYM